MIRKQTRILPIILTVFSFSAMIAGCMMDATTPTPIPSPTVVISPIPQAEPTGIAPTSGNQVADTASEMVSAVEARTPVPTPTATFFEEKVDDITEAAGLNDQSFLGLPMQHWIDVIVSILLVLIGYFVVIKLLVRLIQWLLQKSDFKLGKTLLREVSTELQWLLLLLLVRSAVFRLDFLTEQTRTILDDLFFIVITLLLSYIGIRILGTIIDSYDAGLDAADQTRLAPVLTITRHFGQLIILIVTFGVALSHFGISNNALSATILILAIVVALGVRDIVVDVISGFIILTSQPFRIGDSIYVENLKRRGEIMEIGLRTTKIRTLENREVIIPNSKITNSEIVNYAYPDSSFRLSTGMWLPYGIDMAQARQVLTDAARGVAGVLPDKPVEVLFLDYGKYARRITVRWWVANYDQEWTMRDKVNSAMEVALIQQGIEIPYPKYDLFVHNEDDVDSI